MWSTFFSLVTCAIAIAMPEFTSPMMKLTLSRSISLRVFCTPVPTSLAESSIRQLDRPAENAALLVDLLGGEFGSHHFALGDRGINAGQGIDHADLDRCFAAGLDDEGG